VQHWGVLGTGRTVIGVVAVLVLQVAVVNVIVKNSSSGPGASEKGARNPFDLYGLYRLSEVIQLQLPIFEKVNIPNPTEPKVGSSGKAVGP
jgi:hypothetical protein